MLPVHEIEVIPALASVSADSDYFQTTITLYKFYNDRYGVRSSFFRFLHEVLPKDQRDILLSSIEIKSLENPPYIGENTSSDEAEKEKYLFKLRNDYTHKAQV
jgi:hypothetical protein